jgi:plasmid stabilization system protein ParE
MNLIIEAGAQQDYYDAEDYYETVRAGYGLKFRNEFESALERIQSHPHAWRVIEDGYRCCRINRFPYGIIYSLENETLYVLAIFDLRRMPGSWRRSS